jgi:hypothetical protein
MFSAEKYPRLKPVLALLCVSIRDARAIVRNFAWSAGQYLPKPSAMLRVADDDESLI